MKRRRNGPIFAEDVFAIMRDARDKARDLKAGKQHAESQRVAAQGLELLAELGPHAEKILKGMARALWVTSYADWAESQGRKKRVRMPRVGGDWDAVAGRTPSTANEAAQDLYVLFERENDKPMYALFEDAIHADTRRAEESVPSSRHRGPIVISPEEFGHYLAMQALGHGVSWFDDHAEFDLEFPSFEAFSTDGDELEWSPRLTDVVARERGYEPEPEEGDE